MKNFFVTLLVTVFATGAFATSIDRTQVLARADGHYAGLKTVALLADGRLQLVTEEGLVKQVFLNERIFAKLTRDLHKVANVEVKRVRKDFVCMTLIAVIPDTLERLYVAKFDYEIGAFKGQPRLILTERGCMYHVETYPEAEHSQADAQTVREELVLLALANLD